MAECCGCTKFTVILYGFFGLLTLGICQKQGKKPKKTEMSSRFIIFDGCPLCFHWNFRYSICVQLVCNCPVFHVLVVKLQTCIKMSGGLIKYFVMLNCENIIPFMCIIMLLPL